MYLRQVDWAHFTFLSIADSRLHSRTGHLVDSNEADRIFLPEEVRGAVFFSLLMLRTDTQSILLLSLPEPFIKTLKFEISACLIR